VIKEETKVETRKLGQKKTLPIWKRLTIISIDLNLVD